MRWFISVTYVFYQAYVCHTCLPVLSYFSQYNITTYMYGWECYWKWKFFLNQNGMPQLLFCLESIPMVL